MSLPRLIPALVALLLCFGCSSQKKVYQQYTAAGTTAEKQQDRVEAEGWYLSAVERARTLGKVEQSDALFRLGVFYRRQARFADAAKAMQESLATEQAAGRNDPLETARRQAELARDFAALNRWNDGARLLRDLAPAAARFAGNEAAELRELVVVYRQRLTALGLDATGLPD